MSSGFISEKDLAEARQRRQEEWEKVRTEQQPLECPEEPYDGRSLYERLKEQKMKKDMEYEETHKLKNLIRGLDDDEVGFLELIDQNKIEAEKKQLKEEEEELKQFRSRQATLLEESAEKKIQAELKQNRTKTNPNGKPTSQKALLGLGIKRKHDEATAKKDTLTADAKESKATPTNKNVPNGKADVDEKPEDDRIYKNINTNQYDCGVFKCSAILPGIGPYNESSDSEVSSDSDDDYEEHGKFDLVGRKIKKKKSCDDDC